MKILVLSFALSIPLLAYAQTAENAKALPSTKLEAFSARTGIVLVKGFTELGRISGIGGQVTISAREFRDASNQKLTGVWRGVQREGIRPSGAGEHVIYRRG
jgi:NaMN:DMB phosphoribosyltransferase